MDDSMFSQRTAGLIPLYAAGKAQLFIAVFLFEKRSENRKYSCLRRQYSPPPQISRPGKTLLLADLLGDFVANKQQAAQHAPSDGSHAGDERGDTGDGLQHGPSLRPHGAEIA